MDDYEVKVLMWFDKSETLPTEEDADDDGCVIYSDGSSTGLIHWSDVENDDSVICWHQLLKI